MHCDRKKAYKSAMEAGRVAALRQSAGAPMLHPYECLECGCFHLSKLAREKVAGVGRTAPVVEAKPLAAPVPSRDPRLEEARAIIRADRGNFVRQDGAEWWYLVKLGDGSYVMAMTNGCKGAKVKAIEDPDEMARTIYPALFRIVAANAVGAST